MPRTVLFICSTPIVLTLAAAPFGQWYLAWIALVPWLLAVAEASTTRAAILCGWLTGTFYFAANIWWLWKASILGTVVLVLYFGLYWGLAAAVLHRSRWFCAGDRTQNPRLNVATPNGVTFVYRIVAIAAVWVTFEWLRCNVAGGFPWLPLGSTQSPWFVMCQVADIGGPWIVSFWVMLINALAALAWIWRRDLRRLRLAAAAVATVLAWTSVYGMYRLKTTVTTPGPRVLVLQSNFPHLRGGTSTASPEEAVAYFTSELEQRLTAEPVDLAVLPEAAFPPINAEARAQLAPSPLGPFLQGVHDRLLKMAQDHGVAILVGGNAVTGWVMEGKVRVGREIRNSAYFYDGNAPTVVARYDKAHLVPFSEQAPLAWGPAWLRKLGLLLAANRAAQPLTPGARDGLRPFRLSWCDNSTNRASKQSEAGVDSPAPPTSTARMISPICLENIDPAVIARMIRPARNGKKQVGLIANLSNDGWFANQEKYQHLQLVTLRCIENRVPMVRSSNTGVSGFIDSTGRVRGTAPINVPGAVVDRVALDSRLTWYTRYGDFFPLICIFFVVAVGLGRVIGR